MLGLSEFDYFSQMDFIDVRFMENTATYYPSGHVSIQDFVGRRGMVFVRFQKVYFGYGNTTFNVAAYSADEFLIRKVELWKCTFEENTPFPSSIKLYSLNAHATTSAFRIIFRNVTFINTPIQVERLHNITFINSTYRDSSTHTSLVAISSEIRFQGNILFKNKTGYDGGALAVY